MTGRQGILLAGALWACAVLGGCAGLPLDKLNANAPAGTGFLVKTVQFHSQGRYYGVFIPHTYDPAKRWPVIVFLHGWLGEGSDGHHHLDTGMGWAIARRVSTFGFITVMPQSTTSWGNPDSAELVMACLDQVQKDYSTDPDRVILGGLSLGGYGTWYIAGRNPGRFAALLTMCCTRDEDDVAKLAKVPVWTFANSVDPYIPWAAHDGADMVQRINAAGGQARLTVYNTFGHDCWTKAFEDDQVFQWMARQRRPGPPGQPTVATRPAPPPSVARALTAR